MGLSSASGPCKHIHSVSPAPLVESWSWQATINTVSCLSEYMSTVTNVWINQWPNCESYELRKYSSEHFSSGFCSSRQALWGSGKKQSGLRPLDYSHQQEDIYMNHRAKNMDNCIAPESDWWICWHKAVLIHSSQDNPIVVITVAMKEVRWS